MGKSEVLTLDCGTLRVDFAHEVGTFTLSFDGKPFFSNSHGLIVFRHARGTIEWKSHGPWEEIESGDSLLLSQETDWGKALWRFIPLENSVRIELGLLWDGRGDPPLVESIAPLRVPEGGLWKGLKNSRHLRFYSHGWQCWSPTGILKRSNPGDHLLPLFLPEKLKAMVVNPRTQIKAERGVFTSEWFAGIARLDEGESVVLGFTKVARAFSQVYARLERNPSRSEIRAECDFEGKKLEAGKEFYCEPLVVIPGDLSGRNFEAYAENLASDMGVTKVRRLPVGWCSWYQYYTGITASEIRKNLFTLSENFREFEIEVVQLDDGYQKAVGDWLRPNEKFSDGLSSLAKEIENERKIPGIWLAPFTVQRKSKIFKEKKDWLVKSKSGKPVLAGINPLWGGRYYGLDLTNEEVLSWLRDVFEALHSYGFRFFKLDFLASAMVEGERKDNNFTRVEAGRRALEVIREAVGNDSYILGGGGPILLGVGIFDAQRIGGDVAHFWKAPWQTILRDRSSVGLRNSLLWLFTRFFLNGRVFDGDPDCVMVRGKKTRLKLFERQTLASAVGIFGGAILFSDDLSLWDDEAREMAARLLPHERVNSHSPYLWQCEMPNVLVSDFRDNQGEYKVVLIVNFSQRKRSFSLNLNELGLSPDRYHAFEYWGEKYLGIVENSLKIDGLEAHASACVRLTPNSDEVRLIGTNINISQGSEVTRFECGDDFLSLRVKAPCKRRVFVLVFIPFRVSFGQALGVAITGVGDGVWRVEFELEGEREVIIPIRRDLS